jgi:hypothetical protein
VAGIGDGDAGIAWAVLAITTGQLFGKVHGIAVGAAVAAGEYLAFLLEGVGEQPGRRLDVFQILLICQERLKHAGSLGQLVADQFLVHGS